MTAPFKPVQRLRYRPSREPTITLGLGARSVGHYRVPPGWSESPVIKHFVQVFWGVAGTGTLVIGNREFSLAPGQIALYFPGHKHQVSARMEPWEYRWWTMDGTLAESIASGFGLVPAVFDAGPAPVRLFDALEKAILDPTPEGERSASILAYELLSRAAAGKPAATPGNVEQAVAAIHREWSNPDFSVKALADRLGIHRSLLSRSFRRAMGISMMEYVMRLRLQESLSLLKQTTLPVAEIAPRCGFLDPDYFARLLRRKFHASPTDVRRNG